MSLPRISLRSLEVSRLCYGTLTIGPLQLGLSPEEGGELLVYAAERGINFVDTAELYDNYAHIAYALRRAPDLVVCSKAYAYDARTAQASLEKALRGIGRDYIDILMLHEQESEHTLRGHEEALLYWEKMRDRGHIRHLGISTHHVAAVRASLAWPLIEILHPIYNRAGLGIQDGGREDMAAALRDAAAAGKDIFAMKALGGGHLINDRRTALAHVLSRDFIGAVAVGMQSREEIDYNIATFSGKTPDESVAVRHRHLLIEEHCEGCGKCVARCDHKALRLLDGRAAVEETACVLCGYCAASCPLFNIKVV